MPAIIDASTHHINCNHPNPLTKQGQFGILTPPFDGEFKDADSPLTKEESILAEALLLLLQDNSLRERYKQVSCQRIDAFRTERIIEEWMDVFKNL